MSFEDLNNSAHFKNEPVVNFDTGVSQNSENQSNCAENQIQQEIPFYLMRAPPRNKIEFAF